MPEVWEFMELKLASGGYSLRTSPEKLGSMSESLGDKLNSLGRGEVRFERVRIMFSKSGPAEVDPAYPDVIKVNGCSYVDLLNALSLDGWEFVSDVDEEEVLLKRLVGRSSVEDASELELTPDQVERYKELDREEIEGE